MKPTPQPPLRLRNRSGAVEGQIVATPSALQLTGDLLSDLKSIVAQLERDGIAGESIQFQIGGNIIHYEFNVWLKHL